MLRTPKLVNKVQVTLGEGGAALYQVLPLQLNNLIRERLWEQTTDKDGNFFKSFETFVKHRLPQGLESSLRDLLNYCRNKPEVQLLIKGEVGEVKTHAEAGSSGGRGNKASNNVTSFRGNAPTYALRRLKRDRPDLAAKVIAGKLSAHAAAIEAGFRTRMVSVPADSPENAVRPLIKLFGKAKLINAIGTAT